MKRSRIHNKLIGQAVSRAVIATDPMTGDEHRFESGVAASWWVAGHQHAAGNISKACASGRISNGYRWRKA